MEIAERMISAGAEVYRVEESLSYMCKAYGAVRADAFVTTSNMTLNVEREDGTALFEGRRVRVNGFDVECIDCLNNIIRFISKNRPDVSVIEEKLEQAKDYPKYKSWQHLFFCMIITCSFTVFFGSRDLVEIGLSAIIGALVGIVDSLTKR